MAMNGTITLVSNKDDGRTTKPQIPAGMTIRELIAAELGMVDPDKFQINVNGKTVTDRDSVSLQDGDFVIVIPKQVKGN